MLRRVLGVTCLALCALGVALFCSARPWPRGQGFRWQSFAGRDGCSNGAVPVRERVVPEPFLRDEVRAEGCERFTALMLVERSRLSMFEIVSLGRAQVRVDGKWISAQRRGAGLQRGQGGSWFGRGVYLVEIEHRHEAGRPSYLRVHEDDLSSPHFKYGLPPLDLPRYFVDRAHAAAALEAGVPSARPWRALAVFGVWLLAGVCAWLAWRAGNGGDRRALPIVDLALASALSVVALFVRAAGIATQDAAWDELAYVLAGRHFVRNVQLGDFSSDAFRYNYYHPPLAKWLYGIGFELGAQDGARMVSAVLSAASVGVCYGIAKLLYGRRVAFGAAAISAFVPGLVAHGRVSGLESVLVFFWLLSVLGALCWQKAVEQHANVSRPSAPVLACVLLAGMCAALACGARLTAVWIAPVLLLSLLLPARTLPLRPRVHAAFALGLGALLAGALLLLLWPWLAHAPLAGLRAIEQRWDSQGTTEVFLGQNLAPPPAGYYLAAFAATTPALLLLFAACGTALGLHRPGLRRSTVFALAALLAPFLQSFSPFRQDLARYVIQAWPALAVLAALGAELLTASLVQRAWFATRVRPHAQRSLHIALAVALPAYTALELRRVEPYPLDYFGELVGGPSGVASSHAFELAWWGEGFRDAIDYVNRNAPPGSRVQLALTPDDAAPKLRDDLLAVTSPPGDFVVTNHYKFQPLHPRGCTRVHTVRVAGAPLVDVYRCLPVPRPVRLPRPL